MSNLDVAKQAVKSRLFGGVGYYEGSSKNGPHAHVDIKDRRAVWWQDKTGAERPGLPPEREH